MQKRTITLLTVLTVVVVLAASNVAVLASPVRQDTATLPNGVAAGDVTQTSVVLWTHSTALGSVTFEYGTDATFEDMLGAIEIEVIDALVPVKVSVENLTPDTQYYYRATDAAGSTAAGQFRTPAQVGNFTGLRFGVSGDWRGELAPYPAVRNAPARDLDFFVAHGDTIYADFPSPDLPALQALTLEDYRIKNNEVYSARYGLNTLADLRAATAIFATIDDHEVTNDFAGGAASSSDSRFAESGAALINDTDLYANGMRAFQDYNPVREEFYGDTGDPRTAHKIKFYRYQTFGSDAAIFVLDARSFRDQELAPVTDLSDAAQAVQFLAGAYNPDRTMLGQAQFDALTADLLAAHEAGITWKFVMMPEPIQTLGLVLAEDRYEGYYAERTRLLQFIVDHDITNVVFISADIHGTLVNDLEFKPSIMGEAVPTGAFDISTGPVAFEAPFGPTVIELGAEAGLVSSEQVADYEAMTPPEQDTLIETLANAQTEPFGYTPIGLQDAPGITAELVQGGYMATQYFGWTEFEINAETQVLRVTTYGIAPYGQPELDADPDTITSREPQVVSAFVVTPQ